MHKLYKFLLGHFFRPMHGLLSNQGIEWCQVNIIYLVISDARMNITMSHHAILLII